MLIEISPVGNVTSAVETSPPLGGGLDESALRTVRTWEFRPAMRDGKLVPIKVEVEVSFQEFDYGGGHRGPNLEGPTPPRPLSTPDPAYTDEARRARLEGTVRLQISVDTKGRVKKVKEIGPKLGMGLDQQAIKTARTWTFQPATLDGKPMPARIEMRVRFKL